MPSSVQLGAQVEHQVWFGRGRQLGRRVVRLERGQHLLGVVNEVQHVGRVLAGVGAVQARERLHRLDAGQAFVHVHAAQQRLVEPGLELVGDQQDLVFLAFECFADVAALEPGVQQGAVFGKAVRPGVRIADFAGERHQGADGVCVLLDVLFNGHLPAHRFQPAANHHHHHRLGLAA